MMLENGSTTADAAATNSTPEKGLTWSVGLSEGGDLPNYEMPPQR